MKAQTLNKRNPEVEQISELGKVVNSAQHNPINLLPFLKVVAPLIGRIAARAAIRAASTAAKKRFTSKKQAALIDAASKATQSAIKNIKF